MATLKKDKRIRARINSTVKNKTGLVANTEKGDFLVDRSLWQYIVTGREHDLDIHQGNKLDLPTIVGASRIMK